MAPMAVPGVKATRSAEKGSTPSAYIKRRFYIIFLDNFFEPFTEVKWVPAWLHNYRVIGLFSISDQYHPVEYTSLPRSLYGIPGDGTVAIGHHLSRRTAPDAAEKENYM